jgi:hypothetical protein
MTKVYQKKQISLYYIDEHAFFNRQLFCSCLIDCDKCNGSPPELDEDDFCHTCNTQR